MLCAQRFRIQVWLVVPGGAKTDKQHLVSSIQRSQQGSSALPHHHLTSRNIKEEHICLKFIFVIFNWFLDYFWPRWHQTIDQIKYHHHGTPFCATYGWCCNDFHQNLTQHFLSRKWQWGMVMMVWFAWCCKSWCLFLSCQHMTIDHHNYNCDCFSKNMLVLTMILRRNGRRTIWCGNWWRSEKPL